MFCPKRILTHAFYPLHSPPAARTQVHIEDAVKFVREKSSPGNGTLRGTFDVIINDVPNPVDPGATTPIFASPDFLRHVSDLLRPEGIYVMNQNLKADGTGDVKQSTLSTAKFEHSLFFNNRAVERSLVIASKRGALAQTPAVWEAAIKANVKALGLDHPDEVWRSSTALIQDIREAHGGGEDVKA